MFNQLSSLVSNIPSSQQAARARGHIWHQQKPQPKDRRENTEKLHPACLGM